VADEARRRSAEILADKINLLLDALRPEAGEPFDFATIQQGLKDRGVAISRTKWHYLKTADTRVRPDQKLLEALVEVFGVDPRYLVQEDGPLPQQVEQELATVRALRRAEVRKIAARALGQIDPEGLQAILEVIEKNESASQDELQA
jgi:DNA-directed RNA polymerase subunit F